MLYDLKDWLNQMYKGSNPLGPQVPPQGHVRGIIRVDSPIMMRRMKDEYEEAFRAETGSAEMTVSILAGLGIRFIPAPADVQGNAADAGNRGPRKGRGLHLPLCRSRYMKHRQCGGDIPFRPAWT